MIRSATIAAILIGLASSQSLAWDSDFFGQYLQRKDTVTLDAGNAKATNSATHIIDPWPPNAFNRKIPGNGERGASAVERYRTNTPAATPCPPTPQFDIPVGGLRGESAKGCAVRQAIERFGNRPPPAANPPGTATTTIETLRVPF